MPQTQGHEFYHDDGVLRMQMLMSLNDMGKFCKFARHRDACCAIATAEPFFSWKVQLRKPQHWLIWIWQGYLSLLCGIAMRQPDKLPGGQFGCIV